MEITTADMDQRDIMKMEDTLERSLNILKKVAIYLFGISSVILFVPREILKLFTRRSRNNDLSGALIQDVGWDGAFLYFILPICILLAIIYFYGAHRLKKDLTDKLKEIGIVNVSKIEVLDAQTVKDISGTADHIVKFEKSPLKVNDIYFLKRMQPELMEAKQYRVEVAKHSKVELKREIIN